MTAIDELVELTASVSGQVLRPGTAGYDESVRGFNLAHVHRPEVVVRARNRADVAAAVRWARARPMPVAVQATGHGANFSLERGMLIDTAGMQQLCIDPDTQSASVGAGVKWRRLVDAAAPYGLVGLHGSATDVGVVGYTLGGGLPLLGRAFGYAAERVRAVELVTGDGRVHRVDAGHEPELLWAVRGGKTSVGIVTAMSFELLHVRQLYGGGLCYPGEHADAVLRAYARWTANLPDQLCTSLGLLRLPPAAQIPEPMRGRFVVQLRVAGAVSQTACERLLAPMRTVAPVVLDSVAELDRADMDRVHMDPDHPVPASESCVLLRELPEAAVDALLAQAGPASDCPLLQVELRHLGGALASAPSAPDAIGSRDAAFLVGAIGIPAAGQADAVAAAHASLTDALAPFATGRTAVNMHGSPGDAADRARAWTPKTYARLRQLKAVHDPANLFRFGHAIEPL